MKSHNKFWLFMIIEGVGLGPRATAYTQLADTPETHTQHENAVATQPHEGDDADESEDDEWKEGEEGDDEETMEAEEDDEDEGDA